MSLFINGNTKIHESVLCFSLPPIKTCPNCEHCSSCCYALKSYRMYENARDKWEYNYELSQNHIQFVETVLKQLPDKRRKRVVRIHVAGDFYHINYLKCWTTIAASRPKTMFYGYTKTMDHDKIYDYWFKNADVHLPNWNIINSIAPDGLPNFGPPLRVFELQQQGYFICPASHPKNKDKVICGLECKHCHIKGNNKVVFYKH